MKAALLAQAIGALAATPDFTFDLGGLLEPSACGAAESDEIVVCGKRDDRRFRLPPLDQSLDEAGLPRAETRLFGSFRGAIENESVSIAGAPSNRIMLRLKTPF